MLTLEQEIKYDLLREVSVRRFLILNLLNRIIELRKERQCSLGEAIDILFDQHK